MRITKIMAFVLLLIMTMSFFTGCFVNKYNAVLYDDKSGTVKEWIDEQFLVKNRVNGYYKDENGELIKISDRNGPLIHIITEKEYYDEILTKCPLEIDFNTQMVVIYIFSAINNRNYYLKSIECEGGTLHVEMREYNSIKYDTSAPSQRCFLIVMDKVEIVNVEVNTELSAFRFQEVKDSFEK